MDCLLFNVKTLLKAGMRWKKYLYYFSKHNEATMTDYWMPYSCSDWQSIWKLILLAIKINNNWTLCVQRQSIFSPSTWPNITLDDHGPGLHRIFFFKSMLINKNYLIRLLIGWEQCCQPILSQVTKLLLTIMDFSWKFLSYLDHRLPF